MISTFQSQAVSPTPYQYTSLSAEQGEFRVLVLLPGPPGAPLVGCIQSRTQSDSHGFYDTMSYCWGSPEKPKSIRIIAIAREVKLDTFVMKQSVSLGEIPITASVDEMLRSMRSEELLRHLWIDQICINQEDIKERAAQVKMMRIIYMNAKSTVVWLGHADEKTELGLQAGLALAEMKDWRDEDLLGRFDVVPEPLTRPDYWPPPPPAKDGEDWSRIESRVWQTFVDCVLMRSWFERTWVIQELALSSRPVVMIGDYLVKWDDIWAACDVIVRIGTHVTDPLRTPVVVQTHRIGKMRLDRMELVEIWESHLEWTQDRTGDVVTIHPVDNLRRSWISSHDDGMEIERLAELQRNLALATLLPATKYAKSTDPKDKVFALLSISTTGGFDIIDYSRSLREVYLAAAAEWSSSHGIMELLDHVDTAAPLNLFLNLPTWLPLWHLSGMNSLLDVGDARAGIGSKLPDLFPPKDLWNRDVVPFAASGVHILTVKDAKEVKIRDVQSDRTSNEVVADGRDHANMINCFPDEYPLTGERYIDCYPKVIEPKAADYKCDLPRKKTFWEHKRSALRTAIAENTSYKTNYTESELVHSLPFEYHRKRFLMSGKQCTKLLFFTTNDGFMGLCSLGVQPGDKVCSIFGGRLLYVLRETKYKGRTRNLTMHLFMGNCYIYGLMNGEALEGYAEDEKEIFTLV